MQAEIDGGARTCVTTEDKARIQELERENRELRRANEILKTASAFLRGARPSIAQALEDIPPSEFEEAYYRRGHASDAA